jgi:hypothetical protein
MRFGSRFLACTPRARAPARLIDMRRDLARLWRTPDAYEFRFHRPHLDFVSVDFGDENDLRVYFRRIDGQYDDRVELDDLSSGEKSAIGLILPTVERRCRRSRIKSTPGSAAF